MPPLCSIAPPISPPPGVWVRVCPGVASRSKKEKRVSEVLEAAVWLVYAIAAITMLGAIVAAVLAGFALRFVAAVLREITGEGREEGGPEVYMLDSSARLG